MWCKNKHPSPFIVFKMKKAIFLLTVSLAQTVYAIQPELPKRNPVGIDRTPYSSTQLIGSYDLPFYFDSVSMMAALNKTENGRFVALYVQPETFSPHNVEMLITESNGEVYYKGNPQPEIGYVRYYTTDAPWGGTLYSGYTISPGSAQYTHDFFVFSLNDNGVINKSFRYETGFRSSCTHVLVDSAGMLLTGIGYDGKVDDNSQLEGFALRTDLDGKVIWKQKFDNRLNCGAVLSVPIDHGDFLFLGFVSDIPRLNNEILMARIDKDGNVLWRKDEAQETSQFVRDAHRLPDGDVALFTVEIVDDRMKQIPAFRVYDLDGQLQFKTTHEFDKASMAEFVVVAEELPNGNYLTLNTIQHEESAHLVLREISPQGTEIWARRILDGYSCVGSNMVLEENGDVVLLTTMRPENSSEWPKIGLVRLKRGVAPYEFNSAFARPEMY